MDLASLHALNSARRDRRAAVMVTDLDAGEARVLIEGDAVAGTLGQQVTTALRSGKAVTVEVAGRSLFLNVYLPPPLIVVVGAVHISQALARMAPVAGYDLRIVDPRTAFATPERFAGVDLVADWPEDALKVKPLDRYTALVAVTHDPKIDDFPLVEALRNQCFYVGALGSRKTHAKRVSRLAEQGVDERALERIAAPIGLDIGAANPQEIAVAILAQIVQAYRLRHIVTEG
jgi:xanthine dehydrogenase accessory factor